jgi:hypothetical protein
MNRRNFLKSLAALGASLSLPLDALATAPKAVVDQAWASALDNPLVFNVARWGAISLGSDDEFPTTRRALFDFDPVIGREDLANLAGEWSTFTSELEEAWQEHDADGHYDDWESWLADAPEDVVEEVVALANAWLEGWPSETDYEIANLRGYTDQGAALTYFRDDFEYNDLFNIVIVEGDHPGSSYYAAELLMDVADANALAREEGLPIRFEWSE